MLKIKSKVACSKASGKDEKSITCGTDKDASVRAAGFLAHTVTWQNIPVKRAARRRPHFP